jgi:orotidine-5'-phosphate decarboxylase
MPPAKARLIFALDVPDQSLALNLVETLREEVGLFKVGLELYLAGGTELLKEIAGRVGPDRIFLDLKLYDIPATVLGAMKTITTKPALFTLPSDLGPTGLQKIAAASAHHLLAVTVLTSNSAADLQALGYRDEYTENLTDLVVARAKMAQAAGCRGVVCSGREVAAVKAACGAEFLAVCPGIRPSWLPVAGDDQSRTVTPYEAIKNGADYIVVGRPLRNAGDAAGQAAAARLVAQEIEKGLKDRAA